MSVGTHPRRSLAVALLLSVLGAGLQITGVAAAQRPARPTLPRAGMAGYDVSWPQCGGTLPAPASFAVVGATGGKPLTHNACLGGEFAWANAGRVAPALYVNVSFPGGVPQRSANGPAGRCAAANAQCHAYNYGWSTAQDALAYARAVTGRWVPTAVWWLDVETMNSWTQDTFANSRAIAGAIAYLRHQRGVRSVGIYSTAYQFSTIAGGARFNVSLWVAGAPSSNPRAMCAPSHAFAGGTPRMVQVDGLSVDLDVAC